MFGEEFVSVGEYVNGTLFFQAPDREAQVNEHFVAFVQVDGKLFEFGEYVAECGECGMSEYSKPSI